MRTAIVGTILLLVSGIAIASGILPPAEAENVLARIAPILVFVVAITVVTELAETAGLFTVIAEQTARLGRGRAWLLWLITLAVAVLSTIFLSLDTTAVFVTPVIVLLARNVGLPPLPFALATVWMANTASLLLPVSNLTNLLAQQVLPGFSPIEFATLMAAPAVVAILIPASVLFLVYRKQLVGRYVVEVRAPVADPVLLVVSTATVGLLLPMLVSGIPVWIPALTGALVLVGIFLVRNRAALGFGLIPWPLILLATGLFLFVQAAHSLGLGGLLRAAAGAGQDPISLLRLASLGTIGANLINNLPAYLALEPTAGAQLRLAALIIGVNVGALITPWASLATLLWYQRLVALKVKLSWLHYSLLGLLVTPVTVTAATFALSAAAR